LKTITDEQARLINDARAEGIVALSAAILEKDILVTEALRALSGTVPDATLVFAGGTCLSKAHGLVQRMSEDVDLRVVAEGLSSLTRNAQRTRLRSVDAALQERLVAAGFEITDDDVHVRNEHKKFAYELRYKSAYGQEVSLRPTVLIELVAQPPRLPTSTIELRPLIDVLTGHATAAPVNFSCIAVEETYCEKIVSYLRRAAEHISGREHSHYEERHARHVYDVHCIESQHFADPAAKRPSAEFIQALIDAEAHQFRGRGGNFDADPIRAMLETLAAVEARPDFKEHYARFTSDLIYGDNRPSFKDAYSTFRKSAEAMFAAYPRRG
jgi:predicted nucleotidyltransferase component of viral defense system